MQQIFSRNNEIFSRNNAIIMPPFEEGGAYCVAHVSQYVGMSVDMSVSFNLVQLITQERFAPEASNFGR